MKLNVFFNEVEQHLEYLADGHYSFDEYLKLARENSRVRNAFVFFALSNNEYVKRFFLLSSKSLYVRKLKEQLHRGLVRAAKNDLNRGEVVELANKLLLKYFRNEQNVVTYNNYDESAEMQKFLESVTHHYYNRVEVSDRKLQHRESLLKQVNRNNLFVKA